jgi:predicted TIM-barrel fold metal-dependent hydrolase
VTQTPIIDAHHHIWWVERTPWLAGPPVPRIFGEYSALRRDYTIEDFASDARPNGVEKSIYVQINVAPGDEISEVEWATSAGATAGLVQGVVSFADLSSPNVGDVLDQQQAFGTLRGVRQQLHWHPNPAYRFAKTADEMLRPDWRRGLREVTARELLFELQVFVGQYENAIRLVAAFPDTTFVLLHAGMLEDRSTAGWAAWRGGLRLFAARSNVYVKLSGLGTFIRSCTTSEWQAVIEQTVEVFGPERCMFGSNFPIEKLWTTYSNLVDVFQAALAGYSPPERHRILYGVAADVYRI